MYGSQLLVFKKDLVDKFVLECVEIMEDSIKEEVLAMEGNQTIEEDVKLEDPLKPDIHVKSEGIYDLLT